ncbi:MAG: SigE family polymerase sigma factor [Nocardioides sp.]|jgi:RNA polymerase sigma-70 factor (sigma-E family)|uniref:SigE family RNA polymerase sigma factor n=1 Tax=Nocardioides sp. TaxID=35761 RepID=UPI002618632C|nr:SigE family RNA polymerase sigma factor [Nocardioides sp.]MCW2835524.1 SigE family polymerase sigma factor [Nocardioides sp.]
MRRNDREAAYTAFVLARQDHLRRMALALCGDWHDADDLLQTALIKLYAAWSRVAKDGNPEAYVRRILVHANIDAHRTRQRGVRTVSLDSGAEVPGRERLGSDEQSALIEAVQSLPEVQRKLVVPRHWLGLDVRETARELNLAEGTVKSHSSRGLAALQLALGDQQVV